VFLIGCGRVGSYDRPSPLYIYIHAIIMFNLLAYLLSNLFSQRCVCGPQEDIWSSSMQLVYCTNVRTRCGFSSFQDLYWYEIHTFVYTYLHMYICMYTRCISLHIYIYICVCDQRLTNEHLHMSIYIYICTYIYVYMCEHIAQTKQPSWFRQRQLPWLRWESQTTVV